ncbi:MAG: DNA alkylation repair protein [Bacteroidetes bacterium]|nr:DNA alkylation repair protein [Bacteroidota bacterium]
MKYVEDLYELFKFAANPELAKGAEAYMKNQFKFFGIYTNERRTLSNTYIKQVGLLTNKELVKIVKELYNQSEREFQYVAMELIAFHKKQWAEDIIELAEFCITHKSWWDTVDNIASLILTDYFKKYPHQIIPITSAWNNSSNMWLQRSSIMFQKAFKKETNSALLSKYILNCNHSKEFFIQKAIGWALREYSKTNPMWVKNFVANNTLAPLSKREALKRI